MKTNQRILSLVCVLAALTSLGLAQGPPQAEKEPFENRYRVGIDCLPISEPLQFHLNLDEGTGLLVHSVMDGSPAAQAGIQRLDVIVTADERPVGAVQELVKAVNEAGNRDLELAIIRRGEEMTVRVTPEERDEQELEQLRQGLRQRIRRPGWGGLELPPEIQRQLERFGPLDDVFGSDNILGGRGFRRVLPGVMMEEDGHAPPLPDGFNLNLRVDRSGDGPAKITVQRDGETWEVTEDHLDDLPDDIRPMVENMLNGHGGEWSGLMVPRPQGRGLRPGRTPRRPNERLDSEGDRQLKKRFDGLELQLQELQNAIRTLREEK